jgi:hypothetical protein
MGSHVRFRCIETIQLQRNDTDMENGSRRLEKSVVENVSVEWYGMCHTGRFLASGYTG